jgi:hypothetical protein
VPDRSRPQTTEDGRWIVVDGRRWRATDPAIPHAFRAELVAELMDARRAVGTAKHAEDAPAEAQARARVHDAKVALGERGTPWWQEASPQDRGVRIAAATLALARHRAPRTTCPSDVARAVGGRAWRGDMDLVRAVVRTLASDGQVEVLQRGEPIDPTGEWRGPVRVRLRDGSATPGGA